MGIKKDISKIELDIIQKNLKNKSFEDQKNIVVFDNFTEEPIEDFELMSLTSGPLRMNTIIIGFCTEGHAKFTVGVKPLVISKNMFAIIHPDQIVETTEISSDFKAGFIVLKRNFFEFQNDYVNAVFLHNFFIEHSVFRFSEEDMQEYLLVYNMLKKKANEVMNIYRMQIIQNLCQIMFYNISNIFYHTEQSNTSERKNNNTNEIYERFIKCVEKNYRKEHSVKYYADSLCISPKYMSTVIYEASGRHASEWIHEFIILEAKALLRSTKMSLQDISETLNFQTPSHFGRFFKRYCACSPRSYRTQLRIDS